MAAERRVGGDASRSRPPVVDRLLGSRVLSATVFLAVIAAALLVLLRVDLSPRVESDFFFASDDPQLQSSRAIGELFPTSDQLLISATAQDIASDDYIRRIGELSEALLAVDGVASINSLTNGPPAPQAVPGSPLWSRLLLAEGESASQLIVVLDARGDGVDSGHAQTADGGLIRAVEAVLAEHHSPSFSLAISGVPYVVEQVRRALERDLRVFSSAALIIFGLMIGLIYRSWQVVVGTLVCCLGACALTLVLLSLLGVPIGLLTANLVTIVFVLTLSHIVFLTANFRRLQAEVEVESPSRPAVARRAAALTLQASLWCMLTTLLGFLSLLLASAKPLRELGLSAAIGTAVAILVAYALYPRFLAIGTSRDSSRAPGHGMNRRPAFNGRWALLLFAGALIAGFGLPRLETDPGLLAYFADGGELKSGLERIDQIGGSSPLVLVVRASDGGRLDQPAALAKLSAAQAAHERDPAVGTALALPLLVAEAQRMPMAFLASPGQLIDLLDSATFDHVARNFVTADRLHALLFLRMHEAGREAPRRQVIDRLVADVDQQALVTEHVGGLYQLQAALADLVAASLLRGLGGLLVLFAIIAAVIARTSRTVVAMLVSLAAVPVALLGAFGWLGQPLDVISSPAANVAIALGIDAMIHLTVAARRLRRQGLEAPAAWRQSWRQLAPAIVGATAILAAGFAIFTLSSFPPTQRFGLAVAAGTVMAALMALLVLPWLAAGSTASRQGDA